MRKLKNSELERLTIDEFKKAKKVPIVIVLDNVRSLNNIGSVFRTADAFLVEKIYLCGITATPPHKDIRKTALGATESVAWEYCTEALDVVARLQSQNYRVLAVEQAEKATFLNDLEIVATMKYALIFGNEVKGVDQEVVTASDEVLEIPQFGTKHSLNIAVSVGVLVWHLWSKLNAKSL
ncbi:MAG: RNA methyltransferase [Aurantibacter sp.]